VLTTLRAAGNIFKNTVQTGKVAFAGVAARRGVHGFDPFTAPEALTHMIAWKIQDGAITRLKLGYCTSRHGLFSLIQIRCRYYLARFTDRTLGKLSVTKSSPEAAHVEAVTAK
jgi:hypothetical protein